MFLTLSLPVFRLLLTRSPHIIEFFKFHAFDSQAAKGLTPKMNDSVDTKLIFAISFLLTPEPEVTMESANRTNCKTTIQVVQHEYL